MRCCKDLGVASELWDPRFIREFKAKYCVEVFVEHVPTKKKWVYCFHVVLPQLTRLIGRSSGDARTSRSSSTRTRNRYSPQPYCHGSRSTLHICSRYNNDTAVHLSLILKAINQETTRSNPWVEP